MRFLTSAACVLVLSGCGGSSSAPTPPPPPPANQAPVFSSPATANVTENAQLSYQAQASDADGDSITFSISGGADASLFTIDAAGNLQFNVPPNFELPSDADRDNVYRVNIAANDGQSSGTVNLSITVTNDREGIAVRRIVSGLDQPTYIAPIPGDDDVFVIEKGGRILRLDPDTGQQTDVRTLANISAAGEGGLLGIAMPSDYQANGFIYVFVTNSAGSIEIRRFTEAGVEPPQGSASLLTIPHPNFTNHYGGWIGFGPDDLLYIATGDGGGAGDPDDNAQDVNSRLGKILRVAINPDPFAGATPVYFLIPPGNPFANGGGAREIYALGLRNPFRASFSGNSLLIGDVGQNTLEEVSRLATVGGGATNFGWPFLEGSSTFQTGGPAGLTDPVTEYANGTGQREGASVIGGVVYDGAIVDLFAKYVFADFISGNIWAIPVGQLDGSMIAPSSNYELRNDDFEPDVGTIDQIVAIVRSDNGDIYIVDFDGEIFVVEPA